MDLDHKIGSCYFSCAQLLAAVWSDQEYDAKDGFIHEALDVLEMSLTWA